MLTQKFFFLLGNPFFTAFCVKTFFIPDCLHRKSVVARE